MTGESDSGEVMEELNNTSAPFTGARLLAAVKAVSKHTIRPRLGKAGLSRWVEDAEGTVMESAWAKRSTFDPERGLLEAWVTGIARHRVSDIIAKEVGPANGDLVLVTGESDSSPEEVLETAVATHSDQATPDIAEQVAEHLEIMSVLRPVLAAAASVMETQAYIVGVLTHMRFDDDIAAASKAFALSPGRVRECRRAFDLHCQVIRAAMDRRIEVRNRGVRARDLLACLPPNGTSGASTRETAKALLSYPGKVSDVPVDHVMKATGFERNTARQYMSAARSLLQVAAGVLASDIATKGR